LEDVETRVVIGVGVLSVQERAGTQSTILERLYEQHAHALYRFALALVGSAEDAEDAVQEVFVRIARDPARLERVIELRCYLFTATRNAAYGILRRRQRAGRLDDALRTELTGSLQAVDSGGSVDAASVFRAFAQLPVDQREVLVLKVFDGMTFKEIAGTLGVSQNTAASRYRYGIAKLRRALEVSESG